MMEKKIAFEEAMLRLDDIVKKLEVGAVSLDDSLALFEEGVSLVKLCNERLETAEQKVRILVEAVDGSISDKDFINTEDEA